MNEFESPREGWHARWRWSVSPRALVTAGVLAGGTLAFVSGGVFFSHAQVLPPAAKTLTQPSSPKLLSSSHEFSFADLVERVSPAVVTVQVDMAARAQTSSMRDMMPDLPAPQFRSQAAGSGFIIQSDGHIVTNNHVVENATKITVKLADGREFEAKLIGADKDTDIALLKIEARNLPTVELGDDHNLRVGDWVIAVGNPFGLGGTVTAGIVSSIGRDIGNDPYTTYIQLDAPINRGNSGGPTFDISGRVVGMNTVIFSPSGGSVGIGFAVPSTTIKAIVDELKTNGSVSRGWLGVQIQDFTPELASSLGIADQKGAMVADVVDGSPAARAGFVQGDVVIAVNGNEVTDSRALTRQVAAIRAGGKATFTVLRNGERRTLIATIEKRDADRLASATTPAPAAQPGQLGMSLAPMSPAVRQQYDLGPDVTGVVIGRVDPDSEAASKGLNAGDVIKRVGNQSVRAPADVTRAVDEAKRAGRDTVLLLVANEQGDRFVALRISQG